MSRSTRRILEIETTRRARKLLGWFYSNSSCFIPSQTLKLEWFNANDEKRHCYFKKEGIQVHRLGLDHPKLLTILQKQLQSIQSKEPFAPIFFPFSDSSLENTCLQLCTEKMIPWKDAHSLPTEYIIHKHKLRDRNDVIAERNEQLKKESRDDTNSISAFMNVYFVQFPYTFHKN